MTIQHLLNILADAGKAIKPCQLYRYLKTLKIKPAIRLRPAIYPPDTATRILNHLGLTTFAQSNGPHWAFLQGGLGKAEMQNVIAEKLGDKPAKLHTMASLKAIKRKGGK